MLSRNIFKAYNGNVMHRIPSRTFSKLNEGNTLKSGSLFEKVVHKLRHQGPGYTTAITLMFGVSFASLYFGKSVSNEQYRCGLAGITSTLVVEVSTHCISTLDVHAKTTKNFSIKQFLKSNPVESLFKGFQPMIYGYVVSSFFYYSLYKAIKEGIKSFLRKYDYDEKSLTSIAIMSAGSSAACETIAIIFYYPFDLIKARMQRSSVYNYKNTTDGFYQIFKEQKGGLISSLYKGAGIFTFSFGLYTVFEFMFYETILAAITKYTKGEEQESSEGLEDSHHAKKRNLFHILISSFIAGGLSATLLNPFEYWLARAQNSEKSVRQIIWETKSIRSLWRGAHFSIVYYACTASFLFITLEKTCELLDCSISEAE
ncbi:unnamed protein product [Moneuplotes crassus]|uniref:Mitochondrial carrier protein n=1 Tax=Euplotes crassus TaxID=5936 RepID=A0AAD1USG0_EUPCR|nr:unnamed protein product [Moneuplotes crassus]